MIAVPTWNSLELQVDCRVNKCQYNAPLCLLWTTRSRQLLFPHRTANNALQLFHPPSYPPLLFNALQHSIYSITFCDHNHGQTIPASQLITTRIERFLACTWTLSKYTQNLLAASYSDVLAHGCCTETQEGPV